MRAGVERVGECKVMEDEASPSRRNLNLFYTLDAILNSASLSEAAKRSHLSQPAISMALKKARSHFNDDIVTFSGGKMQFTMLALELRPRIRRSLREAQQILDLSLEFDPRIDVRTIRISMPDYVEVLLLPHILRLARSAAPFVDLHIVPFDFQPVARQFEKDIDFVIVPHALVDPAFAAAPLYDETLSIMVASTHPLVASESPTAEEYKAGSHAGVSESLDMLVLPGGTAAALLATRNVVVRTASYAALPRMIVDTDLIVTTSGRYAQYCASIMDLVALQLPVPPDPVEIVLQWQSFRDREPMMAWFVQIVRSATQYV